MPESTSSQVVHLDAGVQPKTISMAIRPDSSEPTDPVETVRSHDDHNFLRDDRDQPSTSDEEFELPVEAPAGRSRLTFEAEDWAN